MLDIDTVMLLDSMPNASYVVYDAPPSTSFETMFNAMINDGDTVISNSWSECEDETSLAEAQSVDSVLQQAAASGISVFNGTGDSGSSCLDGSPDTVGVPADSPNATAVGGSTPTPGPGLFTYGSETWWNGTANTPPTGQGGFGVSKYFTRPAYQNGLSSAAGRSIPDVVADADPDEGIQICQADAGGCPTGLSYGGTSMAAPEWAAYVADLNEMTGTDLGNVNAALYPLVGANAFHSAASMGSDFAHVGLGSPDIVSLADALSGLTPGPADPTLSEAIAGGPGLDGGVPADGSTQGAVEAFLADSSGNPVSGKTVTLTANSGSSAVILTSSGVSDSSGVVVFPVTDTVPETVTFTITDTTDGIALSTEPTLAFVPPPATLGSITATPPIVANNGTSTANITVTLKNAKNEGAEGKTVAISDGSGNAQITPTGATPGVTNSSGVATFTATDTQAETVTFTATDTTDGDLPVQGSAVVNYTGDPSAGCTAGSPTGENGASVTFPADNFPTGPRDSNDCDGAFGMAFDTQGNLYVADQYSGGIYKFAPGDDSADPSTLLSESSGEEVDDLTFGTDGELYGVEPDEGSVVQIDTTTGATVRTVASGLDSPAWMATDPLTGDLFVTTGSSDANPDLWRISDPSATDPTVSTYITDSNSWNQIAFAPNGTLYAITRDGRLVSIGGTNTTQPASETNVVNVPSGTVGLVLGPIGSNGTPTSIDISANGDVSQVAIPSGTVTQLASGSASIPIDIKSGPDGCIYSADNNVVFKVTSTTGSCNATPSVGPPQISLSGPGVVSPAAGSSVTFKAQLSNVSSPSGTPVLFTVSGANPQVKLVDASANGSASFTYSAVHAGADTVSAQATVGSATPTSSPITFTWVAGKDTSFLTLNGSQEIGALGQAATFTANLSDISPNPATPVDGASISVLVGTQSCTITTGTTGSGSCQVTPLTAGLLPVSAVYVGSSGLTSSSATASFFAGGPSTTPPSSAPSISSAASDSVPSGTAFTFPVTTTGSPTPAITLASGSSLPTGVTLTDNKNGTATLAGTSSVAAGTYKFTIQAANGVTPNATQVFTLTVTAPTVTSIAVTPANPSITKGGTEQFTATATYSDKSTANITSQVTWSSGTTSVATITSAGLATGVGAGSSTITATLGLVSGNTKLTVTAPTVTSIAVTPANPSITKGGTEQFTATATYSDKSTANITSQVTWSSGTTSVATITSAGLATGVGAGSSTITATLGLVSGNTKLTVTAPTVTSIAVTPANPSITKGGTEQFTATATYSDKSTANITSQVTWSSGTTSVATITSAGLATGVGAGSSTITATLGLVSGNTKLTVTAPPVTLDFTGSISYLNSGSLTSGGFTVSTSHGVITSVTGTGTIPGLKGGSATIRLDIHRTWQNFWGRNQFYVGTITVYDSGARLFTTALEFSSGLTLVSSTELSGVAHGLSPDWKSFVYTLDWTLPVNDVNTASQPQRAARIARPRDLKKT